MDVNNTKLHLLLGRRDWDPVIAQTAIGEAEASEWATTADDRAIAWDADFGGIALLRQVPMLATGSVPGPSVSSRGATVDGFRNVFWISDDGREIQV